MITPQDIREKTFEKAVFGGYDMASVDAFLEQTAADLALLQKENATLKAKMKVLVSKVEEYRENEDALRMAVVSAQKMGNMIENDAKAKAEQVLSDARGEAARITGDAALQVEAEKRRLKESQEVSARFIESMNALCHRQLDFLEKVSGLDFVRELREEQAAGAAVAEDSAEIHETVKSIEETIAKVAGEPVSDVRPDIAPRITEDEMPTKAFNIVSDPSDEVGTLNPFDLGE